MKAEQLKNLVSDAMFASAVVAAGLIIDTVIEAADEDPKHTESVKKLQDASDLLHDVAHATLVRRDETEAALTDALEG